MIKLPSFQFYPGDWMKDPALRSVSLQARGLWIDMLCLMFECDRRGHLQHATGQPMTAEQLSRIAGCSTDEVSRLLQELENSGVFSRTDSGTIYSRRLSREERIRKIRSIAGKKGGNPEFKSGKPNPYYLKDKQDKQTDNQRDKQKITPSSSTSSSSSTSNPKTPARARGSGLGSIGIPIPENLKNTKFFLAWKRWIEYRRELKKPLKPSTMKAQVKKLADWGIEDAIRSIDQSILHGWQGLFEPKGPGSRRHGRDGKSYYAQFVTKL